jgi:hypothetical protein
MQGHRFAKLTLLGLALGAALLTVGVSSAQAQCHDGYCAKDYGYHGQSYYTKWAYSKQLNGYYCQFHFKPYASYSGYVSHLCIYYPNQYANKTYFYDPSAKHYYGCYDYQAKGFCLLGAADRHQTIAATPVEAFGKPGALPKLSQIAPVGQTPLGQALIGAEDPQIQAPPGLPPVEPQVGNGIPGIVTPPQVTPPQTTIPTTTPEKVEPMGNPSTPLVIGM